MASRERQQSILQEQRALKAAKAAQRSAVLSAQVLTERENIKQRLGAMPSVFARHFSASTEAANKQEMKVAQLAADAFDRMDAASDIAAAATNDIYDWQAQRARVGHVATRVHHETARAYRESDAVLRRYALAKLSAGASPASIESAALLLQRLGLQDEAEEVLATASARRKPLTRAERLARQEAKARDAAATRYRPRAHSRRKRAKPSRLYTPGKLEEGGGGAGPSVSIHCWLFHRSLSPSPTEVLPKSQLVLVTFSS